MKKNYIYNLLLSVINILFPVLSFPYAAHILGPAAIGKVQFVISFAQYFAIFAALGIPIYGIKETAKHRGNPNELAKVVTEISSIFFISSILFTVVYAGIIFSIPFFRKEIELYIYAGILILFGFTCYDWFFSGIEEFKNITLRSIVIKAMALIALYLFVRTEKDMKPYLFITLFSIVGYQILSSLFVLKKTTLSFHNINLYKHIAPLLYLFSGTVVSSMYTIFDTVLLGFLSNNKAVGLYTAAVKIIRITLPFVTSLGAILIPSISKNVADNEDGKVQELLTKSFNFFVLLAIPLSVGLYLLSPEIILLFSGKKFLNAVSSMQILSVLPVLVGFGHLFAFQILVPFGKNKEMFLSMFGGLTVSLLLNFLLVPSYLQVGAAIANISAECIVTLSYLYFIKKRSIAVNFKWHLLLQAITSSIIFIPVIYFIRKLTNNIVINISLSVLINVAIYFLIQIFIFKNNFAATLLRLAQNKILFKYK